MTPLIDVMLVLMVLFMLAAPLIASSLKLDLPVSEAATPAAGHDATVLAVAVDAQGQLFLDEQPATLDRVQERARELARQNRDAEVALRADRAVPYGRVAELIGRLQTAGLTRIGLVTEPPPRGTKP